MPPAGLNWERLLLLAERHRVGALLHRRAPAAIATYCPPRVAARFATLAQITAQRTLQLAAEYLRLTRLLTREGIATLGVKGLPLAQRLYGEQGIRHAGDIDLFIRLRDVTRADQALRADGLHRSNPAFALTPRQQRCFVRNKPEFEYIRRGSSIRIELLWRLEGLPIEDSLWEAATPEAETNPLTRTLPPELDTLYVLHHGARHGWFRLFWLLDAALLLRAPDFNWQGFISTARRLDLALPVLQAVALAHELLHVPPPPFLLPEPRERARVRALVAEAGRQIAREPLAQEGVREWSRQLRYRVSLQQTVRRRWAVLAPHVHSPESWRALPLPDRWFFLYPLLTPWLWLRRRTPRTAVNLPLTYRPSATRDPALRELQVLYNRVALSSQPRLIRPILRLLDTVYWPLQATAEAAQLARRKGAAICAAGGPHPLRQVATALRLAITQRCPPHDYYYFHLWHPSRGQPGEYLADGRTQGIFRTLARDIDRTILDDKRRFSAFCDRHGFATPMLLASCRDGLAEFLAPPTELACDLFFKLRRGTQATDVSRWDYIAATGEYRRWGQSGTLSRDALLESYARLARAREFLVQPRLRNHPDIADLGNDALCTVRMITVVGRDGQIAEFASAFNIPYGQALANNLAEGAISCPVDAFTGALRAAFDFRPGAPRLANQPHPGTQIEGRVLPCWREAITLACAAHAKLAEAPAIGWDIALTPEGPMLLEGNVETSLNFHQLPPNPPLARTALPGLLLWHLRRKLGLPAN